MSEDPFDAVALTIFVFVVGNSNFSVRLRWNDGLYATLVEIGANGVTVVSFVGKQSLRGGIGQINQRVVRFAVGRLAGGEVEGDGPAFGISETVNFTGEPAPRAAKSSLMNPPLPPAAETWARTVVESML